MRLLLLLTAMMLKGGVARLLAFLFIGICALMFYSLLH
jgi:hypothetical protein